jgi:hypothetical protein
MFFYRDIDMKPVRVSFDFSDNPKLIEMLRLHALQEGTSQKAILVQALEAYFSHKQESAFILKAAEKVFQDWDNVEDSVYDTL